MGQATKRSLEGSIHTIQAEIDGMLMAAKNAEEKSKKALLDAARLADELRAEQDHSSSQLSAKKSLEAQLSEFEGRLGDAEAAALKGGKAALSKLAGKLQQKIKTYKQQIEEAEEIAALNLAKFRKAQQELEETEDRAKIADANMSVVRMM